MSDPLQSFFRKEKITIDASTVIDAIEECAKIAEQTEVRSKGHPQIDSPALVDMKREVAKEIRKFKEVIRSQTKEWNKWLTG